MLPLLAFRLVARRAPSLIFPRRAVTPMRSLLRRVGIAVAIVLFIAVITWIGRGGYGDGSRQRALMATTTAVSPGQSENRPVVVRSSRSARRSETNESRSPPKRCGAAYDIDR